MMTTIKSIGIGTFSRDLQTLPVTTLQYAFEIYLPQCSVQENFTFLVKHIIGITCAKNSKNRFTFVEVIHGRL